MAQMVAMALYSLLLMAVLVVGAPYWLLRMATSGRYRAGLGQRLGRIPAELRAAVAGRQVVWVHAVSVGEVLAATRLVAELEAALGAGWIIVVSTTTATGQALARDRFGAGRVFFYPLDFAWAGRAYLRALQPKLLVLMESELWPRMLVECGRRGIPVAVANARVSDRSYARGVRVKAVWGRLLRRVGLFLAQSEEDARRLVAMGARTGAVRPIGNLKYDVRAPGENAMAQHLATLLQGYSLVVAGSTLPGEEDALLDIWRDVQVAAIELSIRNSRPSVLPMLLIAPRHPDRFEVVEKLISGRGFTVLLCSKLPDAQGDEEWFITREVVLVLDTLGDLAAVYGVADVAFVGGSLVPKGGHNPLEPAQFGVPVVMGSSYENFRDIVAKVQAADGIRTVLDRDDLERVLIELLTDRDAARAMGERGRAVFEAQSGATGRAVAALLAMVKQ